MKYKILPPYSSHEKPFIKEFDTYEQMMAYLSRKNDEIYQADPATEQLSFRPGVL